MRRSPEAKSRVLPLLLGLIAASALAACGGGGGDAPFVAAQTTIAGTLTSTAGGAIAGATVNVGTTNTSTGATATTTATGGYSLTVPTATLNTATTVVVTVAADGYAPCTTNLTLTSANNTVAACTTLTPLAVGELVPAAADVGLTRLGDGQAPGAANSQLQVGVPATPTKTILLGSTAGLTLSNYQSFTVSARIRGLEASLCADKVTIFQGATPDVAAAAFANVYTGSTNTLADSPSNGDFRTYAVAIPVASLSSVAGNLYIKFEAGLCSNATAADPLDDFEFVDVKGQFTTP